MKRQILAMALVASTAACAVAGTPGTSIVFNELPFSEGTLYVAAEAAGKNILMNAVEVESDSVSVNADLSAYAGKEIAVKAFQDLNGNRKLDTDTYGRPVEPCLQTAVTPTSDRTVYTFQLIQY